MWKFWRICPAKNKELEKLVVCLKRIEKPSLTAAQKSVMRVSLEKALQSGELHDWLPSSSRKLSRSIFRESSRVRIPVYVQVSLKERILSRIEQSSLVAFGRTAFYYRYFRSFVSAVLLVVFSLTAVFVFPFDASVTYARATYLDDISGQVFVKRGDTMLEGKDALSLLEGDVILTREGGYATVHFFDDSLGRLNEGTQVKITQLSTEPLDPLVTSVKVFLAQGRLWSRVVNLVDERSRFTVDTPKLSASVSKKAAFDVSALDGSNDVSVFDNVVDVAPVQTGNSAVSKKTVVAGFKINVPDNSPSLVVSLPVSDVVSDTGWVAQNLRQDSTYDKALFIEKEKDFQNASEAGVSSDQAEISKDDVILSTPEIEQAKKDFLASYQNLLLAEAMLVRGQYKEGLSELRQFRRQAGELVAKMPQFYVKNEFDTLFLGGIVREKVAQQLKDMAGFVPGDKLYSVKKVLQKVEVDFETNDLSRTQRRLSQAEDRLIEIQFLLKSGYIPMAVAALRDYRDFSSKLVLKLDEGNFAQLKSELVGLVAKQVQLLKVLTALEGSDVDVDPDFKLLVKEVRADDLRKLMVSLEQFKGSYSKDFIVELKDLFDTYLAQTGDDEEFIISVFDRLLNGEEDVSFLLPANGSTESGVVMIVPTEATLDVSADVVVSDSGQDSGDPVTDSSLPVDSGLDLHEVSSGDATDGDVLNTNGIDGEKLPDAGGTVVEKLPDAGGTVVEKLPDADGTVVEKLPDAGGTVVEKLPDAGGTVVER